MHAETEVHPYVLECAPYHFIPNSSNGLILQRVAWEWLVLIDVSFLEFRNLYHFFQSEKKQPLGLIASMPKLKYQTVE